eukprot:4990509-Amphidinium_carterae.1
MCARLTCVRWLTPKATSLLHALVAVNLVCSVVAVGQSRTSAWALLIAHVAALFSKLISPPGCA